MSCPYLNETTDRNRPRTMILFATAISRLLGRVRTSCEMFWKAENICNATVLLVEGSLLTAGLYRFIGSHEAKIAAILQNCMSCPYLSETTDRNRPRGCKLHASPARLNAPKFRRGGGCDACQFGAAECAEMAHTYLVRDLVLQLYIDL